MKAKLFLMLLSVNAAILSDSSTVTKAASVLAKAGISSEDNKNKALSTLAEDLVQAGVSPKVAVRVVLYGDSAEAVDLSGDDTDYIPNAESIYRSGSSTPVAIGGSAATTQDVAVTVTLSATNASGALVAFSIVSSPNNGTLGSITQPTTGGTTQTGTVVYTPDSGFAGYDAFSFKATTTTGSIDSNTSNISIAVAGDGIVPSPFTLDLVQKYYGLI